MSFIETRTENPQHALRRVSHKFAEVEQRALGPYSTANDIKEYNNLHGQVRRRHPGGIIGHLELQRDILIFGRRLRISAPPKKIPYRLKPKI